ncbi:MAG: ATP-binding protein [Burkholderiales bacterium]|nr:ATP-binding protein [Burkholderiales bacterium]MDE1928670.1 ATP-binding protein [Burkholderiales bacterium]MDE2159628.1 ATP-binding protein [Burkholderiales bacterium]MDE2504467.1 ATP-binding protein [Burkholderiales bacterium]
MERMQGGDDGRPTPPVVHELELPTTAQGLAPALERVDAILRVAAVGARVRGRVQLLLEEAVMNVAMHGGLGDAAREPAVRLVLTLGADAVALLLEDAGVPYDPRLAPPPQRPATLAEAVPGGLGVHLMRTYARVIDYERRDGRNRLTLVLERDPGGAPSPGR